MAVRKIFFCVFSIVCASFAQDVSGFSAVFDEFRGIGISFLNEVLTTVLIVAVAVFLILISNFIFRRVNIFLTSYIENRVKSITIKKYKILDQRQILHAALFFTYAAKLGVFALIVFLVIPVVLGIFPQTRALSEVLWGYFLYPVKKIFFGIVAYIPKLITIIVILFFVKYLLKMMQFFSDEIESGRLVIKGFYSDWAKPTYLLLKYMVFAFTVALIFPYLPNSDTRIFQGVSVFVGLIISIGSSSAIGNLVAGLVITYMRPFRINDRIKIGENEGFVVEKSAFVVRIITDKKEYVTFPNITILTSSITNYTHAQESGDGLLIHTKVTYGYSEDWRKIHELLISAARKTDYIEAEPEPFVLQKALDDFYCVYEINAYTKSTAKMSQIYSQLHKNIQDVFREAGLDLTSPVYSVYIDQKEQKK